MIEIIRYFKTHYIPKGSFRANVVTLMTGTAIAQAIPIAISPILTRMYTPKDFGFFALYIAIVSIVAVIATGRYEHAVMLTEKDEDALNLVALSITIAFCVSIITFLSVWIFNISITNILGEPEISRWLYFIPLSILLTGIYQMLNYWSNRKKQYKRLAISRILQSSVIAVVSLVIGISKFGFIGLIVGNIVGQGMATGFLIWQVWGENKYRRTLITKSSMRCLMLRYKDFPRYSIPADFINTASNQTPFFLLNNFFNGEVVGFYSLTQRVLGAPITLIAGSILDVFKQRASNDYAKYGNCRKIYIETFKRLLLFSIIPFVVFFFTAPKLFILLFGNDWQTAGEYARIMSVMFFFRFISSPLGYVLYITEKQKYDLIWQVFLCIFTIISILSGVYFNSAKVSIICFSISYSVMYVFYFILSYNFSKGNIELEGRIAN